MKKRTRHSRAWMQLQRSARLATWEAIAGYRPTGEMVPILTKDDKVGFITVEEAFSSRRDCAQRKREDAARKLANLIGQFKAEGVPITPDVWDRLEADRRQALEDDLVWIRRGRKETENER